MLMSPKKGETWLPLPDYGSVHVQGNGHTVEMVRVLQR